MRCHGLATIGTLVACLDALDERDPPLTHGARVTLEQAKAHHVQTVLLALEWNMSEAAKVLEVDRRTLYRLCKRWGLRR